MAEKKEKKRTRIKCRIDELPEDIRDLVNTRIADVNVTYMDISRELQEKGFEISKSSIGRYALRQNSVVQRLKQAAEQTKIIVEAAKDSSNFDAIGATTAILTAGLAQRIATGQEDIDNMTIEDAAELAVKLERSAVYRGKFKLQYNKGVSDAVAAIKVELKAELAKEPELLQKLCELTDKVASRMEQDERT